MERRNGFAVVNGVPTESAKPTKDLLEEIGPIRVTHYGDFYDFIPDHALADTAYTNLALPAQYVSLCVLYSALVAGLRPVAPVY